MFLEHKEHGEAVPVKVGTLKLSEAIRIGIGMSRPTKDIGIEAWVTNKNGECFACVIGAAYLGIGGGSEDFGHISTLSTRWLSEKFGVSRDDAQDVHLGYEWRGQTREEIAGWLESKGL